MIKESDEDGSMPDTEEIVTAEGGANAYLPQPGLEDLSLPIALRKPKRHKPKDFDLILYLVRFMTSSGYIAGPRWSRSGID